MKEFDLREFFRDLIKELNTAVGDKNLIKLSLDIQLPEKITSIPDQLKQTIKGITFFISGGLINGAISIEIIKQTEHEHQVNAVIKITGAGSFRKNYKTKEEGDAYFKSFPYSIYRKTAADHDSIEFTINLSISGKSGNKSKLPFEHKRILVAEDNEINAMVFVSFLDEWGLTCTVAVNGAEAVSQTHDNPYDIILMDIYMPILNGIEATKQIREFSKIPIVVLTASTEETDVQNALKAGANDYLLKPVTSSHLFQVLSKYL